MQNCHQLVILWWLLKVTTCHWQGSRKIKPRNCHNGWILNFQSLTDPLTLPGNPYYLTMHLRIHYWIDDFMFHWISLLLLELTFFCYYSVMTWFQFHFPCNHHVCTLSLGAMMEGPRSKALKSERVHSFTQVLISDHPSARNQSCHEAKQVVAHTLKLVKSKLLWSWSRANWRTVDGAPRKQRSKSGNSDAPRSNGGVLRSQTSFCKCSKTKSRERQQKMEQHLNLICTQAIQY